MEYLSHYGVKGMKWDPSKRRGAALIGEEIGYRTGQIHKSNHDDLLGAIKRREAIKKITKSLWLNSMNTPIHEIPKVSKEYEDETDYNRRRNVY